MSWSSEFLNTIKQFSAFHRARFVIESIPTIPAAGDIQFPSNLLLSSHDQGPYYSQIIAASGHNFSAARVQPGEWSTTVMEATIGLTGSADIRPLATRGRPVQIRMGFAGWGIGQYQPLLTGHIQDIGQSGDQWYIKIRSGVASLVSRHTAEAAQAQALFFDYATFAPDTELTAAYVAADPSIQVLDNTHQRETGGDYLIEITPDTGEPFLVRSTANPLLPTRFTGLDATGFFGRAASGASIGNLVRKLWFIEDHPVDVFRKIATSTGQAINGLYDTLPEEWGLAVTDEFFDHEDMDDTKDWAASTQVWTVYGDNYIEDALGFLNGMLSPAGLFIVDRHGKITVRPARGRGVLHYDVHVVNDADIVSIQEYSAFDPSSPAEYTLWVASTPHLTGNTTSEQNGVFTRPARWASEISLPYINDNPSTARAAIRDRVSDWRLRIPEAITIVTAGWRFAHLAPGSHVVINSKYYKSKTRSPGTVYWLVTAVEVDWFGSSTRITALALPDTAEP